MENAKILTEAQIEAIEKVAELVRILVDKITELVKIVAENIHKLFKAIIENYRNTRVIYLATKHGNPLVRKKNQKRIVRWLRRYIRCKE
jgi:hypothetical protein